MGWGSCPPTKLQGFMLNVKSDGGYLASRLAIMGVVVRVLVDRSLQANDYEIGG